MLKYLHMALFMCFELIHVLIYLQHASLHFLTSCIPICSLNLHHGWGPWTENASQRKFSHRDMRSYVKVKEQTFQDIAQFVFLLIKNTECRALGWSKCKWIAAAPGNTAWIPGCWKGKRWKDKCCITFSCKGKCHKKGVVGGPGSREGNGLFEMLNGEERGRYEWRWNLRRWEKLWVIFHWM